MTQKNDDLSIDTLLISQNFLPLTTKANDNLNSTFYVVPKNKRTKQLLQQLTVLWHQSVLTSHDFLTPTDIMAIKPEVIQGLSQIETLILAIKDHKLQAFMGIAENKIEMLFIAPSFQGKGLGKALLNLAETNYQVQFVDVNEQNKSAVAFYHKMGFQIMNRSPLDDASRPFPILHLTNKTSF